ncbi:MAG TPA: trypsin-like serine protease [Kofleriaceae bacterium]|jgi:secreted trypsin-like serine protease
MRLARIVLVSAAAIAAPASADAPVVGGAPAQLGAWPDAVAVIGETGTCSGTLVAPDVVLTAGHCADINPQRIVAGTVNYELGGVAVDVAATIAHPDSASSYDVAALALATPVPGIAPGALGTACTFAEFAAGTPVELVGFGLTNDAATGTNTQLNAASTVVTDATCTGDEGCRPSIAPGGEFAAGGDGIDTCNGDSGGPVYLATPRGEVVVGVVSRGTSGAHSPCGDGGIYVRTDKIAAWLDEVAGPVTLDSCPGIAAAATPDSERSDDAIGGCSTGRGSRTGAIFIVLALALVRRVRRRRPSLGRACPSVGRIAR